jgi:threonine aldolase
VEQTHNGASGTAIPIANLAALRKVADKFGAKVHMDGARLFNAATTLGIPVSKVVENVDSVTFCLSKGLCCPLGAIVAGTKEFIEHARFNRQSLGGGMRQAGIIAAAGIYALDNMVERLSEDHANAKRLAEILNECGFGVDLESVQSNIVRFKTTPFTSDEFIAQMNAEGIDVLAAGKYGARFVTHWPITGADIERTGKVIRQMARKS